MGSCYYKEREKLQLIRRVQAAEYRPTTREKAAEKHCCLVRELPIKGRATPAAGQENSS